MKINGPRLALVTNSQKTHIACAAQCASYMCFYFLIFKINHIISIMHSTDEPLKPRLLQFLHQRAFPFIHDPPFIDQGPSHIPLGKITLDFLAFRCVQCSIGLADVNVKKYHRKMKIDIEQPGSDTWFFLYPKAIFFRVLKVINTSR